MKAKTTTAEVMSVDNLIILDKSGSMSSIREAAISGVNETLGGIRSSAKKFADKQKQYVTLVLFCNCELTYIYDHTPIEDVKDLTPEQYVPCCCTPLYDAMGKSINRLRGKIADEKDHAVLVTAVTDGLENASKEYSGKSIHDLITELKGKGWVFSYIGTDHDVEAVASTLNITNVINFEKSAAGTRATFARERRAKQRFFENILYARSAGDEAVRECMSAANVDFYKEQEDQDESQS